MKHTTEEILNALKVVMEECRGTSYCSKCPFGTANELCMVRENAPELWEIKNEEEQWRAFELKGGEG